MTPRRSPPAQPDTPSAFLQLVARDLHAHPERVAPFPLALLEQARAATAGVPVDHDAVIEGELSL